MINPLSRDEIQALMTLCQRHNFTGLLAGLAAVCSEWKNSQAVATDANRKVLVVLEYFFERCADEAKLIMLAQRRCEDIRLMFLGQEKDKLLQAELDPPELDPEEGGAK